MAAERKKLVSPPVAGLCLFALILCLFSPSSYGTIFWNNSSGSADHFDWTNGGSDNGLFSDPCLVGGSIFVFHPENFRAESTNSTADITADRMQIQITAHSGYEIKSIKITEYGDYGIEGIGSVSVSGTMFAADLNDFGVYYDNLTSSPLSPITSGQGRWEAVAEITNINCQNLQLILDNNLMAISDDGNLSFIEKKIIGIEIVVPEPATIILLTIGSFAALTVKTKKRGY